ncbi:MAG: UvrB/UvrC motif-containing protein [Lentisphaeria bacterium]|nr:UvrB/UvrC motif-containing protein [Lentisphaeria bacterium]NQZ71201.1 UvrB/UvrC motif-containing protein [Lentisphaeria bacterium]
MKCDLCDNNAELFFRGNIKGKRSRLNLCGVCAGEFKITPDEIVESDLHNVIKDLTSYADLMEKVEAECRSCGTKLAEIDEKGIVGCAECYTVFENYIIENYRSKYPIRAKMESKKLERQLKIAVSAEDFEKAAELQKRLSDIEAEI